RHAWLRSYAQTAILYAWNGAGMTGDEGVMVFMDSQQPAKESTAEEAQQGTAAYPPPPSYYENMQLPAELPPLPEKQSPAQANRPQAGNALPPAGKAGSYYGLTPERGQPYYAPGQYHYPGTVPPASTSR